MEKFKNFRKKITPFRSLAYREYRLLTTGFFIASLGLQMQIIAINWQIYTLTHSAFALGMVGVASFIPTLFLSMFGGLIADKVERKRLLMVTQIGLAVLSGVLAVVTFLNFITPGLLYLLVFLVFSILAFFQPVRQSIIPNLVPEHELVNAVSLNTLVRQSTLVIGPSIAGFLIAFYGTAAVYMVASFCLFLALLSIIPMRIPKIKTEKIIRINLSALKEGFVFYKRNPILRSALTLDFFATFFGSATALLPIFAVDILNTDARGLGILYAATSVGGVLAGFIISTFRNINHQGLIILGSIVVYGLATIGFGLSNSFYLTCFFLLIIGAADMVSTILRSAIRQLLTPNDLRGRVTGINILFAQSGPKLGDAEAGILASLVSAPFSVISGGLACIIITLIIAYTNKQLRNYKGLDNPVI